MSSLFFFCPRADGKGLLNLKDKDSLYTLDVDEIFDIRIVLAASTADNYVFLSQGMPDVLIKHHLPVMSNTATSTISFTQSGLSHLYIEIIPSSALFYPDAEWKTTIWALPVRVNP